MATERSKKKPRIRYFNYMMPVDPNFQTMLQKRQGSGIWQGLFEFPLIESEKEISYEQVPGLLGEANYPELTAPVSISRFNPRPLVHKLSHQHIHTTFWIVHLDTALTDAVAISEMHSYPVPVLIANFMETVKNSYF